MICAVLPQAVKKLHSARRAVGLAAVLCGLRASLAWGQVPAAPAPPPAAEIVRPLWLEVVITIAMIGLALFAVGRNSRRN